MAPLGQGSAAAVETPAAADRTPPPAQPAPDPRVFAAFLGGARPRPNGLRGFTLGLSTIVHVALVIACLSLLKAATHPAPPPPAPLAVPVSLRAPGPLTPPAPPPAPAAAAPAPARPRPAPPRKMAKPTLTPPVPAAAEPADAPEAATNATASTSATAATAPAGAITGATSTGPALPEAERRQRQMRYSNEVVRAAIARRFRYPEEARGDELEGVVMISIEIDATGRVTRAALAPGCQPRLLCEDALRTVRAAAPFPPPPAELGARVILDVPLAYQLR